MRWERSRIFGIIYNVVQSSFVTDTWALRTTARPSLWGALRRSSALSLNTRRIAVIVAYWHWERLVGGPRCWWWWWGSGTIRAGCCLDSSPWRRPSHQAVILNWCLYPGRPIGSFWEQERISFPKNTWKRWPMALFQDLSWNRTMVISIPSERIVCEEERGAIRNGV